MAESSLFAQRLQAITERRRLQERILATRRELEEERLRAQRLKRKSLRDRWLMEGTSSPTDDNDHLSSVWEAQNRIQELEKDLSSLQTQMQQLDNPELHQGLLQPEEPVKALKEVKRSSLDGIGEVDGTSSSPPEERSNPESRLELAPVPPKRSLQATAQEKLQNGDMPGGGVFGSECSPEKAEVDVSPITEECGGIQPPQRSAEAAPDIKLACQSLGLSEASPNCPRKLAVEEMVIRDHLGQEVGSMDAVGQKQSSIGKEEDLEGHPDLGNEGEEGSKPNHLCSASSSVKAPGATESRVDSELGSRDGPEGESPTSWEYHQSPSKAPQGENSCLDSPKWRAEAELEMGSLAKEAERMGAGQKELPEQGAKEVEPARGLAVGHAEPVMGGQGNLSGESLGSWLDQPKLPLLDQIPDPEEGKMPLLDEVMLSSSPLPDQVPGTLQEQIPPPLQDQIPSSFQEMEGSCLEPLLPNQSLSTLSDQSAPLQEKKELLPSAQQESLLDPTPPSLQDDLSSSPKDNPSSFQGEFTSLQDQIPSPLHEANGKPLDQIPTSRQEQSAAALPDQVLSPPLDQFTSLPGQIPSSLNEIEKSLQRSTTSQGQELSGVEAKGSFPDIIPSLSNQLTSLPDQINSLQEAEGLPLEEIPVILQDQMPTAPEARIPSLPEEDIILPGQIPFPVDEGKHLLPGESPASGPDPIPQALLDQDPTFLEGAAPSSLQEMGGSLTDQMQASLPSQTSPRLLEAKGSPQGQAQPMLTEQVPISPQGQATSLQEPEKSLPEKLEEVPLLPGQAPSPNPTAPDALLSSSQDAGQPLLDKTVSVGNRELKEGRDGSLASAAEEAKESLHAEQQPLLQEASADALDISVGGLQPKMGILKLQAATNQEAPTYTTTSANTASSCQLQPTAPRQGEDPEQGQSRRKQKSCQCCSVM
ncbi:paralemmin-3 isoform X1 [Zootoca vivipara]|uniref:paralemmin-3 isoform X1 n=2 Tax=Zootoca vivipara TaxID=8524 RepID=UPI00293BBEDB|nr:paralemmin-3 isoform X1 [Zootoca vivipara]XP_034997032.2 paralemmin-3 isoform X1 [Zootoca vivipara]XP_034997033.2 paralemmin-3 isoform X1 [Zootoca vivipara]XP_060125185.1 paralemmin-3 isoform X1 [Zootoca vivipara]XP_060125186.1 paralemmin-3 isoform X1 [Zootoca vivipara]XP_060125187.1 paralemmin-3 isoform X1 [Zootoca vivipara]XP_060125188.1 paralemmin-3 isoform X1 [Zootoca vivipara]